MLGQTLPERKDESTNTFYLLHMDQETIKDGYNIPPLDYLKTLYLEHACKV